VDLIERRFSNPEIVDTTRRVAFDGSSRHPGFVIPSIRDGLAAGTPVEGLALVSAAWARYCLGVREDGSAVAANDPYWEQLTQKAREARERPLAWLEMRNTYGDLAGQPRFAEAFERWLNRINDAGMEAALDDYLAG
jgi:mannitol 2-dehydrogenase